MPLAARLGAHVGVFEIGIAGVNDEIVLVQVRQQILDDRIHRGAGGHQHHDRARLTKQCDEINDVVRAANLALGRFHPQRLDLGRSLS